MLEVQDQVATGVTFQWEASSWFIAGNLLRVSSVVERARSPSGASFISHLIRSWGPHSQDLSTSQISHFLMWSSLGVSIPTCILGRHKHSDHSTSLCPSVATPASLVHMTTPASRLGSPNPFCTSIILSFHECSRNGVTWFIIFWDWVFHSA